MIEVYKQTMEEFMGLYIDFWQFLHLPSELRIKKKERDFMIHTLALNARGVDINSSGYVKEIIKRLGLKKSNEVYNYRTRVKNKGFLAMSQGKLVLPQALNVKEVPPETFFRFKVLCGEPTQLKNQKQTREVTRMGDLHRKEPPKPKAPKLPEYGQEPKVEQSPVTEEQPIRARTVEEPFSVKLPPKFSPPAEDEVVDPITAVSKAAVQMARERRPDNLDYTSQAVERPASGYRKLRKESAGYATDEYRQLDAERDRGRLPPIPDLDDGTAGNGTTEETTTPTGHIIPGEKNVVPAPVRKRAVPDVRRPNFNIINLDD